MLNKLITLFLIILPFGLHAQILNVEKERSNGEDSTQWVGNVTAAFSLKKQQVEAMEFNLASNAAYFSEKHAYILVGEIESLRGDGEFILSHGFGHFRTNLMRKNKLSYELFSQIQYDDIRGMKNRWLTGAGLRYTMREKDTYQIAIGTGAMYEAENWYWTIEEDNEAEGWQKGDILSPSPERLKSTSYISLKYDISSKSFLNFITYYQAKFDSFHLPRISGEFNLNIGISKHLAFTTKATYWYDAAPDIPIDKTNYSIQNGLTFSL
ncbi:DUF481 domain-containing protein [Algivirga pacifica]|uniref:DUF481 domain-containing protein n=1 Tax=Algivirga pacifica TaxID=1162670 RepID=A0ABP9D4E5_9BACT